MSKLGEKQSAYIKELVEMRDFFPTECDFYWSGADPKPPMGSLMLFREYREKGMPKVCEGCTSRVCTVRLAPNPNL